MAMAGIKAVVFDIGNVLVEWHPERAFDRTIGPARREALFAGVDLDTMNARVDMGEEIADVVTETAAAHPEFSDDILLWHKNWLDMFWPAIPRSVTMLKALRARGVPVFALSNFGTSTLELSERYYPFLLDFDRRFVSGHLAMMKPDPALYAHVEAETGVAPEGLFFIDDRAENIAAADTRGWGTHLFDGPQGLADRMLAEGLLDASEVGR
jgi:2-haloacid dehalogenase